MTLVICATLVTCPTSVVYLDFGCPSRLRSMSQLWTYLLTPVMHHDSDRWARYLSYHLSCERLRMAGLDDCNILQPRHLVRNRLGGMHDLISIQNLRLHSFSCGSSQATCRATKEHLACRGLWQTWVSGWTRYPTTLEDQGFWMSGKASLSSNPRGHGTKNWSHLWKTLAQQTKQGFKPSGQRSRMILWARHMMPIALSSRSGTTWWKFRLPERTGVYDSYTWWIRMSESKRLWRH
jgi:hypothetical protein